MTPFSTCESQVLDLLYYTIQRQQYNNLPAFTSSTLGTPACAIPSNHMFTSALVEGYFRRFLRHVDRIIKESAICLVLLLLDRLEHNELVQMSRATENKSDNHLPFQISTTRPELAGWQP